MTRNATNGDKHINEATKQTFANNLFKISCKYTQGKLSNRKICFNVLSKQYYNNVLCILSKINEVSTKITYDNIKELANHPGNLLGL